MNEIKCPECGNSIILDKDSYSNVLKQIRDQAFENEIKKRHKLLELDKQKSIDLAIQDYRFKMQERSFLNEKKLQSLQSQLAAVEAEKSNALNKIKYSFEKERDSLSYLLEKTRENNEYDKKISSL